jgi:hypothetical protein
MKKESTMGNETKNDELLERYLQAVRFLLPDKQRQDVIRELRENLRSEIEENEAERGRPLDEEELGALLRRLGHPFVLALRYRQSRALIGPAVFPLYWFAVKFVLGILAVVHLVLPTLFFLVTGEPSGRVVALFLRFPSVVIPVLGWITIGFAVLDTALVRGQIERALSRWSPRSLPPVLEEERTRPPSVTGVVLRALLSVWWLAGMRYPPLVLGPAASYIGFGRTFHELYVPMVVAAAGVIFVDWIRLTRPHLTQLHRIGELLVDGLGLAILYLLWNGGEWFVAREGLRAGYGFEGVIESVNFALGIGLPIALVATGLLFFWKHLVRPVYKRHRCLTQAARETKSPRSL